MKKYALYLPQFHEFKENNEWWGKGYTEWVNVKKAKTITKWHKHPLIPSNGYYDLSHTFSMASQFKYAQKLGVDGFAVYHYWSDGHLLMEKPIENLLEDKQCDFKFYFTWANHNFYDKISYLEKKLLWKQSYTVDKINEHAKYLSDFFLDGRYEKVDGRPIFAIHDPISIPNFSHQIGLYRAAFRDLGVGEIHLRVAIKDYKDVAFIDKNKDLIDSVYEYQPYLNGHKSMLKNYLYELDIKINREIIKKPTIIDATKVSKQILETSRLVKGVSYGFGMYLGWDTTPRWGERGIIHKNFNQRCIDIQKERIINKREKNDFIVITAWNEWGEGAVLEKVKGREEYNV